MSVTLIDVMINALELAQFESWSGDASELARLAGEILSARGLGDVSSEPNVRLIRDYAQRGIVSRAERHGKEAIYGYRQLLEFVAARELVADGWPLAKIAEHFAHIADAELRNLISGDRGWNRALAVARRLRSETPAEIPASSRPDLESRRPITDRANFRRLSGTRRPAQRRPG